MMARQRVGLCLWKMSWCPNSGIEVFKAKTTKTIIYIKGQSNLKCSFLAEYSSYFRHNLN